jgi:hypothetical protein
VRYLLILENRLPARPAAFVTSRTDWAPGDTIVTRSGAMRILEIEPEIEPELRSDFDAVWVVERVQPDGRPGTQ